MKHENKTGFRATITLKNDEKKQFEDCSSENVIQNVLAFIESNSSVEMSILYEVVGKCDDNYHTVLEYPPHGKLIPGVGIYHVISTMFYPGIYQDVVRFDAPVVKSGNSLVIRVSSQCKMMGVIENDVVNVTLRYIPPWQASMVNVFKRNPGKLIEIDDLLLLEGSSRELAQEFVKTYRLRRMMDFSGLCEETELFLFDHALAFCDADGNKMIVSQPYKNSFNERTLRDWASDHNCSIEIHPSMSWHYPGETTLVIIRPAEGIL